jgi:DNA-binding MarR family transcriptional regulator
MTRDADAVGFAKKTAKTGVVCACFNIRKTARVITQLYDDMLRPTGLRVTQFSLLMGTRSLEPVTVSRLADVMAMDRTTLTRNLRPLEKQGLIRVAAGEDRRERQMALTVRGQQALAKALPLWEQAQARIAEKFGRERLQRLFAELSDLRTIGRRR